LIQRHQETRVRATRSIGPFETASAADWQHRSNNVTAARFVAEAQTVAQFAPPRRLRGASRGRRGNMTQQLKARRSRIVLFSNGIKMRLVGRLIGQIASESQRILASRLIDRCAVRCAFFSS
jgi:hypothetical protein